MVFCKDCRFIIKPSGASYEPHPESLCSRAEKNMNYVTGEAMTPLCKYINNGLCRMFVARTV